MNIVLVLLSLSWMYLLTRTSLMVLQLGKKNKFSSNISAWLSSGLAQ